MERSRPTLRSYLDSIRDVALPNPYSRATVKFLKHAVGILGRAEKIGSIFSYHFFIGPDVYSEAGPEGRSSFPEYGNWGLVIESGASDTDKLPIEIADAGRVLVADYMSEPPNLDPSRTMAQDPAERLMFFGITNVLDRIGYCRRKLY